MMVTMSFILATLLILVPSTVHGSCRQAQLCCPGRDSSCLVQKTKLNEIIEDLDDKGCYCDNACIQLGDCCPDYEESCRVTDCEVSDWEPWSDCDAECGLGSMSRSRKVVREPENGGKECPELLQKRGCHGHKCESRTTAKASRESALILSSRYSKKADTNETQDIRKNLHRFLPKDPAKEKSTPYCVVFEVVKNRKGCDLFEGQSRLLQPGSRVCVSCESDAMRKHLGYRCHGHGVEDRQTRWTFLSALDCHGRWIRRGHYPECPCHPNKEPDFIFV